MIKHKKKQTPQDLYLARKEREEAEKDAHLPPGLINHGNTCFMNSTLQGLMATELLHNLVNFAPISPGLQQSVVARRSPQLTNGHGVGGPHEQEWVEGMPLGDVFVGTLRKAWAIQEARRRESMSPKEILTTIGRKYEQYRDFRQQDAHEFLRHMLDAMRMEELDIIKKRRPPPPKEKRRRSRRKPPALPLSTPPDPSTIVPVASGSASPEAEEKLETFVDMLFGGHLASILVCEKCKKASVTYEDFNDLSLSIKPEDYAKGRKRDKLKLFARKLGFRPASAGPGSDRVAGVGMHRSSSVPASPIRRSTEETHQEEEAPVEEGLRRRSFDHAGGDEDKDEARDAVREMATTSGGEYRVPSAAIDDDDEGGGELSEERDGAKGGEADLGREKGEKKERQDPFVKLGRRISVSMKITRNRRNESKERGRRESSKDAARVAKAESEDAPRASLASPARESTSDLGELSDVAQRVSSPVPSVLGSPSFAAQQSPSIPKRPSTPRMLRRVKSPATVKPSREEAAYFQRILADVNTSASNPFSLLHQALAGSTAGLTGPSPTSATAQALWAKLGHLPGIEECLRLFTAVEVLDGENAVGCHRCWKIANGTYKPRRRSADEDAGSDSEESEETPIKPEDSDKSQDSVEAPVADALDDALGSSPESSGRMSPLSASAVSASVSSSSEYLNDRTSIVSAPTTFDSGASSSVNEKPRHAASQPALSPVVSPPPLSTYGGLPIPSISTTAPSHLCPLALTSADKLTRSRPSSPLAVSPSNDTLLPPKTGWHRKRGKTNADGANDESSESSDEYDSESDASASASDFSDASSVASPAASPVVSPTSSVENLHKTTPLVPDSTGGAAPTKASPSSSSSSKVPRSKQVVHRRMYKRYLIATPPPILVIHLKRFHQAAKTPAISFSGGFKKLDEFVAFPEYLDLTPFLAPRKEDFGLGRCAPRRPPGHVKDDEKCMYRLYAVVVHIGNMLGGHYVAYTALPSSDCFGNAATPSDQPATAGVDSPAPPSTPLLSAAPHEKDKSAKVPPRSRQWAYISDTIVRLTTLEEVLKAKAYICMYERI
ncbi:cysteine proteinase [Amylocystis lapponica]|nr:cysteine proteinase [Amylocystis lapponica]